jgi:hypothetical protein
MLAALVIHVTVALCDNQHQGIVPVPALIGNGRDSRNNLYFEPLLTRAGSKPLLLTTGLIAPEAYTLGAAIEAYVRGGDVHEAAAQAYARHQTCGIKGARRLFKG